LTLVVIFIRKLRPKLIHQIDPRLQKKLREGGALETGQRGSNRVSALAGELFDSGRKSDDVEARGSAEPKPFTALDPVQTASRLKPSGKHLERS
jgi:hypothetical protein